MAALFSQQKIGEETVQRYLEAGKAVSTHGVKGELKVIPYTDDAETLCRVRTLYLDPEGARAVGVLSARPHKNAALLMLEGYDSIETARKLLDRTFWLDRSTLRLPAGAVFIADLIGLTAVDADDASRIYGSVTDVTNNGAHDIYHILLENGKTGMVPAAGGMVVSVDLEGGRLRIRPVTGLFDDAY
jgi:16S rRNA processing protein RimM